MQSSIDSYHSVIETVIESFKDRINCDIIDNISQDLGTYHDVSKEILNLETKKIMFTFCEEYDYVGGEKIKKCIDNFEVDLDNNILKFSDPDDEIYHEHSTNYMNNRYTDITNFKVEIESELKGIESAILEVFTKYNFNTSMINSMELANIEECAMRKKEADFTLHLREQHQKLKKFKEQLNLIASKNMEIKTEYENNEDFQKFKKNKISISV
jgi:hypothetical protein